MTVSYLTKQKMDFVVIDDNFENHDDLYDTIPNEIGFQIPAVTANTTDFPSLLLLVDRFLHIIESDYVTASADVVDDEEDFSTGDDESSSCSSISSSCTHEDDGHKEGIFKSSLLPPIIEIIDPNYGYNNSHSINEGSLFDDNDSIQLLRVRRLRRERREERCQRTTTCNDDDLEVRQQQQQQQRQRQLITSSLSSSSSPQETTSCDICDDEDDLDSAYWWNEEIVVPLNDVVEGILR